MEKLYSKNLYKTEHDLLKALLKNDAKAQTFVFESYSPRMLAVCRRYIGQKQAEAEDVMMEGFMKVFDKIGQFKFQGSMAGWIRKIMINEALMYIRSQHINYSSLDSISENIDYQAINADLETEDLMKMIDNLATGYRLVFNLYAIDGYTHSEIALLLGISENTSKSQLNRARAILQKKLMQFDGKEQYG